MERVWIGMLLLVAAPVYAGGWIWKYDSSSYFEAPGNGTTYQSTFGLTPCEAALKFRSSISYCARSGGIKKCIENVSYGGGYFIGSAAGINRDLSLQKVFSFFSTIKELGKYTP